MSRNSGRLAEPAIVVGFGDSGRSIVQQCRELELPETNYCIIETADSQTLRRTLESNSQNYLRRDSPRIVLIGPLSAATEVVRDVLSSFSELSDLLKPFVVVLGTGRVCDSGDLEQLPVHTASIAERYSHGFLPEHASIDVLKQLVANRIHEPLCDLIERIRPQGHMTVGVAVRGPSAFASVDFENLLYLCILKQFLSAQNSTYTRYLNQLARNEWELLQSQPWNKEDLSASTLSDAIIRVVSQHRSFGCLEAFAQYLSRPAGSQHSSNTNATKRSENKFSKEVTRVLAELAQVHSCIRASLCRHLTSNPCIISESQTPDAMADSLVSLFEQYVATNSVELAAAWDGLAEVIARRVRIRGGELSDDIESTIRPVIKTLTPPLHDWRSFLLHRRCCELDVSEQRIRDCASPWHTDEQLYWRERVLLEGRPNGHLQWACVVRWSNDNKCDSVTNEEQRTPQLDSP